MYSVAFPHRDFWCTQADATLDLNLTTLYVVIKRSPIFHFNNCNNLNKTQNLNIAIIATADHHELARICGEIYHNSLHDLFRLLLDSLVKASIDDLNDASTIHFIYPLTQRTCRILDVHESEFSGMIFASDDASLHASKRWHWLGVSQSTDSWIRTPSGEFQCYRLWPFKLVNGKRFWDQS